MVRHTGVDDDQLGGHWQRDGLGRQRSRIDEQRLADACQARRHLVHDADGRADKVVSTARPILASDTFVERESEQARSATKDRHFQGRARRKPLPSGTSEASARSNPPSLETPARRRPSRPARSSSHP
jgi:hypothetical protein